MVTCLQQALRSLCFNMDWKYAVFWKLKHRARMILTWEDAYYETHDHEQRDLPQNMCSTVIGRNLSDYHSHDALGLAVANMSYHVYSLGEGIIGQVAVSGKYMWIFADEHVTDCRSPSEYDGWLAQFSAGVKTVVVVAVMPHGVLQLGSLSKIPDNLEIVNYIRDAFFSLQYSSACSTLNATPCDVHSFPCLSDICSRRSFSGSRSNLGGPINEDRLIIFPPTSALAGKSADCCYTHPAPSHFSKSTFEQQKQLKTTLQIDSRCEGETSCIGYVGVGSDGHNTPSSCDSPSKIKFLVGKFPVNDFGVRASCSQPDHVDPATYNNQNVLLCKPEIVDLELDKVSETNTDYSYMDPLSLPFKFSAGCELYEVLGPAFQTQKSYCDWEAEKSVMDTATEMPEGMESCSLLTAASGSEHLLEAVVAKVCHGVSDIESEKKSHKPVKSMLTTEKVPQTICDKITDSSDCCSVDQTLVEKGTLHCLSSEGCGASSSKVFSSTSHSTFSEQLGSTQPPPKVNKKRARPGEGCRPRPRDRQLIQDRIKELRELVPNGAKCSIDSLLERTIKHMLFMQSITKHAEKLNKCIESKLRDNEAVPRGLRCHDQGSSWAMEVGSHLRVCRIMVENINMNGQMLIEMLCEDCSQFLEISEAIKSLGLTILTGATEACDKKTCMRFVVEGQNNRSLHRMDILWSLVQILQSKTTT